MADNSAIEWTDATWNPTTGCTKISAGCDNCYAARFSERWKGIAEHPYEHGFDLRMHDKRLSQPALWKKPRRIFVNSMSDLFHKGISTDFRDKVFDVMEEVDQHQYQILTKRSSLMMKYINARYKEKPSPKHIWLGTSVENSQAKSRIEHLRKTHCAVRFLSLEPLIGPLGRINLKNIHWVIVGGESGPGARPIEEKWVLDILKQCETKDVAFFFKQGGGRTPKDNGRLLQRREWNEFPIH